jgi:pimeloyl-ACP methyl ester carboxylesterase
MPNRRFFSLNGETIVLNDAARSSAPGKYVRLPGGLVHYELEGPADGKPVVLVNGFSIPLYLWDHTFQPLVAAGFRVLRFDFYGRGYSDRPNVEYGPDLFDRQLLDILEALAIRTPVNLVGSSMGGIVASIFANRHPGKVEKLVLIDPAGSMPPPSFPGSMLKVPILGEAYLNLFGDRFLLEGMKQDLLNPVIYPEYLTNYQPQMRMVGFKRAVLSTLRSGMLHNQGAVYQDLGHKNISILVLWGKEDQVIPLSTLDRMKVYLPNAVFRVIDQCGHVPHYELPEVINPILIEFLI